MNWLIVIFPIFFICIILILFLKDHLVGKRRRRYYLHMQSNRTSLSDEEFCHRAGLGPSIADLVHTIRSRLAKDSGCDPLRIYPDDSFFDDFGWSHGELEMLMGDVDIDFEWEPSYVGEFILEVVRLRKEREQREQANGITHVSSRITTSSDQ